MKKELTKKLAKELMEIKGETRGFNLRDDAKWVVKTRGKEALHKVEEETKRVGFPIEYDKVQKMDFYPAGFRAISLLAIKKALDVEEEEIKNACNFHPKASIVIKLFAKHFYSVPKVLEKAQEIWARYWTVGELEAVDYDLENKTCKVRLKDLDLHPTFCTCMSGYLIGLCQMVTGSENVTCEEVSCPFEGGEHHDYVLKW